MRRGTEHDRDRGVERSVWNGAERRRRSHWERGTRERVARGRVGLWAGAGGYFHEGRDPTHVKRAKAIGCRGASEYKGADGHRHRLPVPEQAGNVWGCGQGTERRERAGPPPGGPVRSIRKNSVLPGSCPTDLHYGKNGYVHTNKKSGWPGARGPGPARGKARPGSPFEFRAESSNPGQSRFPSRPSR